jgi:hypothetical protein
MRAGYGLIAVGVILGAALVALLVAALGWDRAQQVADIAQKLAATAAVVVGGFWVYDRFIRERVAESRLDLTVEGEITRLDEDGIVYVTATVGAENVGSTKVDLDHDYCALTVLVHELLPPSEGGPGHEPPDEASWRPLDLVWFVMQEQDAIEPGASFGDQRLLLLPANEDLFAVRLDLVVQAEDGAYWTATSIVKAL